MMVHIRRRDTCVALSMECGSFLPLVRYSANCMYTNLHHFIELAALDLQRNQFWLIEATKLYDLRPFSITIFFADLPTKFLYHKITLGSSAKENHKKDFKITISIGNT